MTKVNNYQVRLNSSDFATAMQEYNSEDSNVTFGMEVEKFILKQNNQLLDAHLHDKFYLSLAKTLKDKVSVEPAAHMIEIKTGVHKNSETLNTEINKYLRILKKQARKHRLKILNEAEVPSFSPAQLKENPVSIKDPVTGHVRRAPSIMKAYTKLGFGAIVDYAMNSVSVHFTHSTKNMDELHRWAKVHSAFMPLYYAAFENRSRTKDGKHTTLNLRKNMRGKCLVLDYIFTAQDGNDLAKKYVEFVENTNLYSKLDKNGDDTDLNKEETFKTLPQEEQTISNFLQAASFQWGVCKIKPLIDEESLQNGKLKFSQLLLEVRDFETSDASTSAAANWLSNLVSNEDNLSEAEVRLEDLGIPIVSNPELAMDMIKQSLDKVGDKNTEFLDTSIGNKGYKLRDMVNEIIVPMLASSNVKPEALEQWVNIAKMTEPPFKKFTPDYVIAFNDNAEYPVKRETTNQLRTTAFYK